MKSVDSLLKHLGIAKNSAISKCDKKLSVTQDDNYRDEVMDYINESIILEECIVDSTDFDPGISDFCDSLLSVLTKKAKYYEYNDSDEIISFYGDKEEAAMLKYTEKAIKDFEKDREE